MPDQSAISFESLTLDELDLLEETAGASVEDMQAGKVGRTKVLRAFALVALRRTDPQATSADAGKVTIRGLDGMLAERPTGAAGPPATARSGGSPKRRASRSSGSPR